MVHSEKISCTLHKSHDKTVASVRVARRGGVGLCTPWQFRSKPCCYISDFLAETLPNNVKPRKEQHLCSIKFTASFGLYSTLTNCAP